MTAKQEQLDLCHAIRRRPCYGLAAFSLPGHSEKAVLMEVKLSVGNLPWTITVKELDALFAQAGDVTSVDIITDRLTGRSQGYAYVTMSTQNEADKAVSMFNACSLDNHRLQVALVKPRRQRGFVTMY
jgi:RNA recognition motif-containing protein